MKRQVAEEEEAEVNIGLLLTGFCLTEASKNWKIIGLERFQAIEVPWLDNYCCLKHKH